MNGKLTPQEVLQRQLEDGGDIPLYLPNWASMAIQKRRMQQRALEAKLAADLSFREDYNRERRDRKPVAYTNAEDPNRVVIVVGGGNAYRQDLVELSYRTKEKPDPKLDPRWRKSHGDIVNAIDRQAERWKNFKAGRAGVWHIPNNPCYQEKEETHG